MLQSEYLCRPDCCMCPCPESYYALSFCQTSPCPTSYYVIAGGAVLLTAWGNYRACNHGPTDYYYDSDRAAWKSWTTSVAVMNPADPGEVDGVAGGTSSITATYSDYVYTYNGVYCNGSLSPHQGSATVFVSPTVGSISPSRGLISFITSVTIGGTGFGLSPTVNAGSGITVSVTSATNTSISANFNVAPNAPSGNHSVTVTAGGQPSNSVNFYVQVPTALSIVAGTDSTTSETTCTTGGQTGCGVSRSFTYQVEDQESPPQPITGSGIASMQFWDAITTTSPNNLNLTGYTTTCSPANTGPCGVYVNSAGKFGEGNLGACSTVCRPNNTCIAAGPTNANQTWHIGPYSIVQQISYYCGNVRVNGQ